MDPPQTYQADELEEVEVALLNTGRKVYAVTMTNKAKAEEDVRTIHKECDDEEGEEVSISRALPPLSPRTPRSPFHAVTGAVHNIADNSAFQDRNNRASSFARASIRNKLHPTPARDGVKQKVPNRQTKDTPSQDVPFLVEQENNKPTPQRTTQTSSDGASLKHPVFTSNANIKPSPVAKKELKSEYRTLPNTALTGKALLHLQKQEASRAKPAPSDMHSDASAPFDEKLIQRVRSLAFDKSRRSEKAPFVAKLSSKREIPHFIEVSNENLEPLRQSAGPKPRSSQKAESSTHVALSADSKRKKEAPTTAKSSGGPQKYKQIQGGRTVRIFLDDYDTAEFWKVMRCLQSNRKVTKLIVFYKRSSDGCHVRVLEESQHFFQIVSKMNTLKEVNLWNFLPDDMQSLIEGITGHRSLEYFQLHMAKGTLNEEVCEAIASVPKLISLELEVQGSFDVGKVLASPYLLVLSVIGEELSLTTNHQQGLVQAISKNNVLSTLDLEPTIDSTCLCQLLDSLPEESQLETLQFSCAPSTASTGDEVLTSLLKSLQEKSCSLRVLWNHRYESFDVGDAMTQKLLRVLQDKNTSVEQLHIFLEQENFWHQKQPLLDRNVREHEKRDKVKPTL